MEYIIYKISDGNKHYIGVTGQDLKKRWNQHKSHHTKSALNTALHNKGVESFTIEIVFKCKSRDEASDKEREFIKYYNTMIPNGYNVSYSKYPSIVFERKQPEQLKRWLLRPSIRDLEKDRICLACIYYGNIRRLFSQQFRSKREALSFIREQMEHNSNIMRGEVFHKQEIIAIIEKPKPLTPRPQIQGHMPKRLDCTWRTIQEMRDLIKVDSEEARYYEEYRKSLAQNS